jgi:DNA topoisomerase-1
VLATAALGEEDSPRASRHSRRSVGRAIEAVAERLGNTPAICRKSYVHLGVIEAYADGSLVAAMARRRPRNGRNGRGGPRAEEACVLALLAGGQALTS